MINIFKNKKSSVIRERDFTCRRGNLTIRGKEFRTDKSALPIAVVSHEFMTNRLFVKRYAKMLAEMGYAAYCFDFCGGCLALGKSDGETTEMSVLTEVEDLKAVIEYAKNLPYTDAGNVTLMGCSQGGLVSALTAAQLKTDVSRLVLFYPALCIPDDARSGKMMFAKFDPDNIPEKVDCGPMKLGRRYVSDVIEMNPFAEIPDFAGDVLIVHGTKDSVVKFSYIQKAFENYKSRKTGTVILEIIEGAGHIFSPLHDKKAKKYLRSFMKLG